jgi:hypothetical protein
MLATMPDPVLFASAAGCRPLRSLDGPSLHPHARPNHDWIPVECLQHSGSKAHNILSAMLKERRLPGFFRMLFERRQ